MESRPQPPPERPKWAGDFLPHVTLGESFERYCRRIGISELGIDGLLEGLTERTAEIANVRLCSYLIVTCPVAWTAAVQDFMGRYT